METGAMTTPAITTDQKVPAGLVDTRRCLAPDPALPGRDDLLDPALVADLLSKCLVDERLDVTRAELVWAKYRIGESLRVLYRLDVAGRTQLVTGRMFSSGRGAEAHRKALREALPSYGPASSTLRPMVLDQGRDTLWWSFPNDRRLVGLGAVLDPARLPATLRDAPGEWSASAVVQYIPERSVTLRALDPGGRTLAFVKCYAPHTQDVAQLAARYDFIASRLRTADPALRSPRALAHSCDRHLLLLEPMPGRSWQDLDPPGGEDALRRLGRAIAFVHAIPLDGPVPAMRRFGRFDLGRVTHAGELISQARPELAAVAKTLVDRLASEPPALQEQVLLHGDCHPGNVLVTGDQLSLIDLDQAGTGPAAADISSLLARLNYGSVLREGDPATATAMTNAFLEGYAQVRALPDDRTLRWYAAAALLAERGMRAVNRVRPGALSRLEGVLGAGLDLLDGRSGP
jgi:Ser/Thr protein kinase RdoA (MazF antagonist)